MEKIKVVFVDYELVCGGAEQALFDLIHLLDKERFDISLFVQQPGGQWDEKFREAGIKLIYDYSCRKPTFNPVKKLGNVVKKIQTAQAYKHGGQGLLDVVLEEKPDIVVNYSAWCYDQLPFAKDAKYVKYIHGDPGTNPVYREEAENQQELLKQYHRIVCVSNTVKESFTALSGIGKGVEAHYNPIDSEAVRRKAQMAVELPEDLPLVCAVGRLSGEKGFERLIVIHKRLVEAGIAHRLVIVGDGPDRDYIRRTVNAMDAQDTVILAGYQENPYPYMKKSRFLVSSSFTEGLPVIAMEALSLGVPMVAAVEPVREAFGEEFCGIITENDNASLMEGIRKMLTDEALYARAKAGAEKRSAFFDGKRMAREIETMLLELMQEK